MDYRRCLVACLVVSAVFAFGWPSVVAGADYLVTGDGGPISPNGEYFDAGIYNTEPYYERTDGEYAIWRSGVLWFMSPAVGDLGVGNWNSGTIEGDYLAQGDYTGTPTVVPEPATLLLLAIGGAGLLLRRTH